MRRVKVVTVLWLLEAYAVTLALLQMPGGVRTDEAKYLLNIPYPHPPLLRTILSWTAELPGQELFWRLVFATVLVQSVWIVADLGAVLTRNRRLCLCLAWLLSSALILQAGTVVMAVAVGVCGLTFVWFAMHPEPPKRSTAVACLWLVSLFIAYQSVLYLPLVVAALLRSHISKKKIALYVGVPLLLLAIYSLTNPHALLSMVHVSSQDAPVPLLARFTQIAWVWIVAGSGILSIVGTAGILTSNRFDLVAAFGLVFGFIVLSSQQYYAILLLPLFIGGLFLLLCKRRVHPGLFLATEAFIGIIIAVFCAPPMNTTPARSVMNVLRAQNLTGSIVMDGAFGHEWQYESNVPLIKFSQALSTKVEREANAFVCASGDCDDDVNLDQWVRISDTAVPVWVRR